MFKIFIASLMILASIGFSQANSICKSNDPKMFLDNEGNYNFFLYHNSYQIYPTTTDLKRNLFLTEFLLDQSSTDKLCFEMQNTRNGMNSFKAYLNECWEQMEVSYQKKNDVIIGKNKINRNRITIKRCDWNAQ